MRVKMRDKISGTRNGVEWPDPGGEIDLPDAEAAKYCANGLATPVASKGKEEKAVVDDDEVETRKSGLTTEDVPRRRGRPPGSKNKTE